MVNIFSGLYTFYHKRWLDIKGPEARVDTDESRGMDRIDRQGSLMAVIKGLQAFLCFPSFQSLFAKA